MSDKRTGMKPKRKVVKPSIEETPQAAPPGPAKGPA